MIDSLLAKLADIAEIEYADVVIGCEIVEGKLRIYVVDESFLDVWFSRNGRLEIFVLAALALAGVASMGEAAPMLSLSITDKYIRL